MTEPSKELEQYIYETPDLADVTTAPSATTHRTPSDDSDVDDGLDDDYTSGVDTRKIQVDRSRSAFAKSPRARRRDDSEYVYAPPRSRRAAPRNAFDYSSGEDDEEESPQQRLIRLRKELEEIKMQVEQEGEVVGEEGVGDEIADLAQVLDLLKTQTDLPKTTKETRTAFERRRELYQNAAPNAPKLDSVREPTESGLPSTESDSTADATSRLKSALEFAATLDKRLHSIEALVGLDQTRLPETDEAGPPPPILTTLALLEDQLSLLQSTPESLAEVSKSVQQLGSDIERLEEARRGQSSTNPNRFSRLPFESLRGDKGSGMSSSSRGGESPALDGSSGAASSSGSGPLLDDAQIAKINAIYETLPTVRTLSESMPLIVERLRTLRLIHLAAGTASESLSDVETRLREQRTEINTWKASLAEMEQKLEEGEGVLKENVGEVNEWVSDLQKRVAELHK